ncbi:sulfatase [Pseudonocardia sp. S2-4]|uniref:Sulfatase n=1 Tax=Pseudonocardia humida TaxID=2800819 RepID=A0ABT1A7Y7_9PSEU|nr:sulfatase [Pseudonocardia humida]
MLVALGRLLTALAVLLVLVALLVPGRLAELTVGAFLRLPAEAIACLAVLLLLPVRARRVLAPVLGFVLAVLLILRILDLGFLSVLDRQFNVLVDWKQLGDALNVLRDSIGETGTTAATVGAIALAVALMVLLPLAVDRLTRLAGRRRPLALRVLAVAAPVWLVCALLGVQVVPGVPVASANAAGMLTERSVQIVGSIRDRYVFADEIAVDAYRDTPGDQLLTALRGKDVLFTFVESYGRSALENPEYAPQIGALLDQGTHRLAAAGFTARTGYLTSSTTGGNSWLAHAALMAGLWTNDQQRYNQLVQTDRLTLNKAFGKAGWRTVGVMPGITKEWPEGRFFGYQHLYDKPTLDYHGPNFGWGPVPDQFTMQRLQEGEFSSPDHPPVMAEIALVSSHWPWAPLPRMVGWDELGDGSIFNPQIAEGLTYEEVWADEARVRTEYRRSLEYTLEALLSYVETYGDDDTVMVVLGDHQPAPNVTGEGASRDVPITILARDPAVLDRIADWGWRDGLAPAPDSPVWRMDEFRDRFLVAYGPQDGTDGPR